MEDTWKNAGDPSEEPHLGGLKLKEGKACYTLGGKPTLSNNIYIEMSTPPAPADDDDNED